MNWQTFLTIAVVVLAAVFLVRRAYMGLVRRRVGRCAGCPDDQAPAGRTVQRRQVVSVEELKRSVPEEDRTC